MNEEREVTPAMQKRKIRLEDGRYMVFYTFDAIGGGGADPETERVEQSNIPEKSSDV